MASLPSGLNLILLILVIVASAITILQTTRDQVSNSPRWIPISVGLIALALLTTFLLPAIAGYLSATLWILVAIIPSIGFRLSNYWFYRGHYWRAYQLKRRLRWLHPLADWPWQETVFRAYLAIDRGEIEQATAMLQEATATGATPEQRAFYFATSHQWQPLVHWWQQAPQADERRASPSVMRYYLWALGECGELDQLLTTYNEARPMLEKIPLLLDYAHLYLFAFGGKVDETIKLLHTRLPENLNADMAIVWIATAHYAANRPEAGRSLLRPLQRTIRDGLVKFAITERLERPIPPAAPRLSSANAKALDTIAEEWLASAQMLAHLR